MHGNSHNHWTSIADLMSAFVVVLLVLFATVAALPHLQGMSARQVAIIERERDRNGFLDELRREVNRLPKGLATMAPGEPIIRLPADTNFESASACLEAGGRTSVDALASVLVPRLQSDRELYVEIHGHADRNLVSHPRDNCGVFADNMQLSALRAANVRKRLITAQVPSDALGRLPVVAWGSDRLRNTQDPTAAENRRVELYVGWRDVMSGSGDGAKGGLADHKGI